MNVFADSEERIIKIRRQIFEHAIHHYEEIIDSLKQKINQLEETSCA